LHLVLLQQQLLFRNYGHASWDNYTSHKFYGSSRQAFQDYANGALR